MFQISRFDMVLTGGDASTTGAGCGRAEKLAPKPSAMIAVMTPLPKPCGRPARRISHFVVSGDGAYVDGCRSPRDAGLAMTNDWIAPAAAATAATSRQKRPRPMSAAGPSPPMTTIAP